MLAQQDFENETFKWLPTPRKICTWALGLNQREDGLVPGWMWLEVLLSRGRSRKLESYLPLQSHIFTTWLQNYIWNGFLDTKNHPYINASRKCDIGFFVVIWHFLSHIWVSLLLPKSVIIASILCRMLEMNCVLKTHFYSAVLYFSIRAHQDISGVFKTVPLIY